MSCIRIPSLITLLLLLVTLSLSSCSTEPDYVTADGQAGRFKDHHGQWLVINYWAVWCKPCRDEIPELNSLQKQHNNVIVMGVDFDQHPLDQLQPLIKELDIQFTVLQKDPSALFGWDAPLALPMTYIINPQGKLSATLQGPQTIESLNAALQTAP